MISPARAVWTDGRGAVAAIGIYGKHPAFGDFIGHGLPAQAQTVLETWLQRELPRVKAALGAAWDETYDTAPDLRFWFGGRLTGHGTLAGVLRPSRDRVGRRFPLVAAVSGGAVLPPVLAADQALYEHFSTVLDAALETQGALAADGLAKALSEEAPAEDTAPEDSLDGPLWAANPTADPAALLASVSTADHLRAAAGRGYLWSAGTAQGRASAFLSAQAFPDADALGWILVGVAPPQTRPQEVHADE